MSLTTAYSLWLAPLCLLLGIALAWWLYRRGKGGEGFSRNLSIALAACRALAISLIAFFLLEPMVRVLLREVRKPVVVLLHDGSSSIAAVGDTLALKTTYRAELEDLRDRLGDRFDVRTFTYGASVEEGLSFDQDGMLTDMDHALREIHDRLGGPDLGAVIMDGDGLYNRGRDPRSAADALGVPVFSIALGDTTVRPDLLVRDVEHNRIGYLGNELPLLVRIEGRRMPGANTRVSILNGGKEVAGKDIALTGRSAFLEVPFTVRPTSAGMQRYTAVIRPLAGEVSAVNNRMDVLIDVLDDRQKVLLLGAAPHPDLGALRLALGGLEGYGTDLSFAAEFTGEITDYDLIVLHGLPSAAHSMQALLTKADGAGIPVCYILGQGMDFNAFNARSTGVEVSASRGSSTDAQASVNSEFSYFTLDPEQARDMERYPPLQVPFGQFTLGRSATALAYQRIGVVGTKYPLIAFSQQQERRSAVIAGEGLWRWRVNDVQRHAAPARFDRMIHKLVQFLAVKVNKERFRVEHAPRYAENDRVVLSAELYNATFEPINSAEVTIVLKDEAGRDLQHTFSPSGSGYRADIGKLQPGTYSWTARTNMDGKAYTASGQVHVEALVVERATTVADHDLWMDMAARSRGTMVRPGNLADIAVALEQRSDLVARSYAHPSFSDLISLRWLFFIILSLLTLEWVLRRRNGAY